MDLNFGVVGYGAWGAHHADTISRTPGARLISIATPSADSQERAKKAFPAAEIFSNYHEMFQRKDLDVAVIVLPTYLHEEVSTAAFKAGKHVLLEKPMALDAEGCDRILAAAKKSGKVLNVAHEFRFSIQWGAIKKYVEEGGLGDPHLFAYQPVEKALPAVARWMAQGSSEGGIVDHGRADSLLRFGVVVFSKFG